MSSISPATPTRGWSFWWKPLLFLLVAGIGLYYVKWSPYYFKAFVAADNHSIGASILNDNQGEPVAAPLAYAKVYFLAIWKAAVLAVILGSLIQVLIPRDWLLRLFGKAGLGSTLRGGLFALPGMMCTCCAAPVAAGMRRQNVSVGAALAFSNHSLNKPFAQFSSSRPWRRPRAFTPCCGPRLERLTPGSSAPGAAPAPSGACPVQSAW